MSPLKMIASQWRISSAILRSRRRCPCWRRYAVLGAPAEVVAEVRPDMQAKVELGVSCHERSRTKRTFKLSSPGGGGGSFETAWLSFFIGIHKLHEVFLLCLKCDT